MSQATGNAADKAGTQEAKGPTARISYVIYATSRDIWPENAEESQDRI